MFLLGLVLKWVETKLTGAVQFPWMVNVCKSVVNPSSGDALSSLSVR